MRARSLVACVALLAPAAVACDAIYGIRELPGGDAGAASDGAAGDATADGASEDATPDGNTVSDAGKSDGNPVGDGGAGQDGACIAPNDAGAVERDWAQWPMPNSPVDIEGGAPNPQRYTDNGDGTVTDPVTGLMWLKSLLTNGDISGSMAPSECATLSFAGYCDWRAPTYVELQSIVDPSVSWPSIDQTVFPGASTYTVWTSTPVAGNPGSGWTILFTTGQSTAEPLANGHHVRCVRGGHVSDAGSSSARYVVANGTVADVATGLTWEQATSMAPVTWSSAQGYCASLGLNGATWRLPTVGELVTLVDVTLDIPAIDSSAFPQTQFKVYWTSTPIADDAGAAWGVQFYDGNTNPFPTTGTYYVRCVH